MRWDGRPFSVGADAPGRPLLPLRGNSPSAHIGPSYSRLMHLPCNPFLYLIFCQASGGPLDGSLLAAKPLRPTLQTCHWHVCFTLRFRFPPFPVPIPLKTTKEGASGPPSLESPPGCPTDSAPAAGAYAVTPPPHRPVCEKTGERRWNVGAGLVPARRGFPQRRGIEATTRAAPTVAQNRERICRYPVRSSGRRVVISLPPVYTTVSERFFLTFHPVEGVW